MDQQLASVLLPAAKQQQKMRMHGALILANIFFGAGAVLGALGLPAAHPLVFALLREIGAGWILLLLSLYLYRQPTTSSTGDAGTTTSFSSWMLDEKTQTDNKKGNNKPSSKMLLLPYALRAWTTHWKNFAVLGLVVFGNQAGFIVGIKMAGPVTASVWQPSQPIFTAAICMALGWEPIQRKRLIGVLIASLGCVAMVLLKEQGSGYRGEEPMTTISKITTEPDHDPPTDLLQSNANTTARYVMGNFLFFGNCLCTSLYVILSKRMLSLYPPLLVTSWAYNGASIIMFMVTLFASTKALLPGADAFFCPECPEMEDPSFVQRLFYIPPGAIPALLYYVVFASVGSYGLMTWANQHATGTLVMSYTVLQPVTSAILTTLCLALGLVATCHDNDHHQTAACLDFPSWGTFCGTMGVFAGLALIISTEPSSDTKVREENDDFDDEKVPLAAAAHSEEYSSTS